MKPVDLILCRQIKEKLVSFEADIRALPGIHPPLFLECLVEQIVDSIRRIKYVTLIRDKPMGRIYTDASNPSFDPFRAASFYRQNRNINEAFWLVFLGTHFGKNKKSKWNLVREIYRGLGHSAFWDWQATTSDFNGFRQWLNTNQTYLKNSGSFGNHRKYQSLDAFSSTGTGSAIGTYIDWVGPTFDHLTKITNIIQNISSSSRRSFDDLYKSMQSVVSFGRTAKFDYLTMIGKLGLVDIEPGSTYMNEATGPKRGARLLFGGNIEANLNETDLNNWLYELEAHLNVYFGMQVLEDALCNWQKSPHQYLNFAG